MNSDRHAVLFAGVAAATFVAIVQLSTGTTLNSFHQVAVFCFSLILPIAAVFGTWPPKWKGSNLPKWLQKTVVVVGTLIVLTFCVGIGALILSFGFIFGLPLLIGSTIALFLMHGARAANE
jgi:hypothetical protein